jgi:chemotaxis regulatin CheY-phosphate phosphatase CheZ
MTDNNTEFDQGIATLEHITDAILRGEYNQDASVIIEPEGVLANLAQKVNALVVNMKSVESPLTSAGEQAPTAVNNAQNVVELMHQSTGVVLNKSDKVTLLAEDLEKLLIDAEKNNVDIITPAKNIVTTMKSSIFDIIASQSYQDVARQKMEALIADLNKIRDWLIEVLLVLNIKKDGSEENVQKTTELLRGVRESAADPPADDNMKQDLVDDLLAEFGF